MRAWGHRGSSFLILGLFFFVSDHVPFPVGVADDDSWDNAWVSAEDDLAETRRRTWGKRGNMGFFF